MNRIILIVCIAFLSFNAKSQSDAEKVKIPLNDYMVGTSYNYPEQIKRAFTENAMLYLTKNGKPWPMTPDAYAELFIKREAGEFNGRYAKLLKTKVYNDIAWAEIEIIIHSINARFIDVLILQKMEEEWKIVSKTATRYPLQNVEGIPQRKVIMDGLKHPWSMDFISAEEAIVAEKDGDLLLVNLASKEKQVIGGFPDDLFTTLQLDVSKYPDGTYPKGADGRMVRWNAGILEVLLDPDFSENRTIYISYVAQKGDKYALKVIRASLENNQLQDIKTLLNPGPYVPGLFHFGGGITFGEDGKLYITVGERLFYEHLKEGLGIAQDLTDARGKIYRINPDGSIPSDNPDFGAGAVKGIYALGIRAAQGITVEPHTNKIWFSEHGTNQGDELNLLEAGTNYGWPNVTTGGYRSKDYKAADVPNAVFTDPLHYWKQTVAPTGLAFYTGTEFPEWYGNLIVPGLSRGSLWRITLDGTVVKAVEELFTDEHVRLRKATMSPDGKLYLLTDEDNGRIFEVVKE